MNDNLENKIQEIIKTIHDINMITKDNDYIIKKLKNIQGIKVISDQSDLLENTNKELSVQLENLKNELVGSGQNEP